MALYDVLPCLLEDRPSSDKVGRQEEDELDQKRELPDPGHDDRSDKKDGRNQDLLLEDSWVLIIVVLVLLVCLAARAGLLLIFVVVVSVMSAAAASHGPLLSGKHGFPGPVPFGTISFLCI